MGQKVSFFTSRSRSNFLSISPLIWTEKSTLSSKRNRKRVALSIRDQEESIVSKQFSKDQPQRHFLVCWLCCTRVSPMGTRGSACSPSRSGVTKGEQTSVNVYDFLSLADGKAIP